MKEIVIGSNDAGRRLDRFLRKYLQNAPLGQIYKIIRKDVKVDGRRQDESYMLSEGEVLTLYLSDEDFEKFTSSASGATTHAKRQFGIVYEDENILVANKPFGLLTHGDSNEKKNHLANQVKDYLIEQGSYNPREEKVFAPAPANRIDRNTTGLVLFGKTAAALKGLNEMIRSDMIRKYYLTIVHGEIDSELVLDGKLIKDESKNKVSIGDSDDGLDVRTIVSPIETLDKNTTLVSVELVTGRSHQIRAHLASIGHPIIGDSKYGGKELSGVSTQLLHAYRIEFDKTVSGLEYLEGKEFVAELPENFKKIINSLGGNDERIK